MTRFSCSGCGDCCRDLSDDRIVLLFPGELPRLAADLGCTPEAFERRYTEPVPQFAAIGIDARRLRHEAGSCVFLDSDSRCTIHAVKPFQCREGPDRFLADGTDYACMRGVDVPDPQARAAAEIDLFRLFVQAEKETNYGIARSSPDPGTDAAGAA